MVHKLARWILTHDELPKRSTNRELTTWVIGMRKVYNHGATTAAQQQVIDKLNKVVPGWFHASQWRWLQRAHAVQCWVELHGRLPEERSDEQALVTGEYKYAIWLRNQRVASRGINKLSLYFDKYGRKEILDDLIPGWNLTGSQYQWLNTAHRVARWARQNKRLPKTPRQRTPWEKQHTTADENELGVWLRDQRVASRGIGPMAQAFVSHGRGQLLDEIVPGWNDQTSEPYSQTKDAA